MDFNKENLRNGIGKRFFLSYFRGKSLRTNGHKIVISIRFDLFVNFFWRKKILMIFWLLQTTITLIYHFETLMEKRMKSTTDAKKRKGIPQRTRRIRSANFVPLPIQRARWHERAHQAFTPLGCAALTVNLRARSCFNWVRGTREARPGPTRWWPR